MTGLTPYTHGQQDYVRTLAKLDDNAIVLSYYVTASMHTLDDLAPGLKAEAIKRGGSVKMRRKVRTEHDASGELAYYVYCWYYET